MIKKNTNCQNDMKQLTINNHFTKKDRILQKIKRININQDSIQTENITTFASDYNNNQNHTDDNAVPYTLDQETLKQIENDTVDAAVKETNNRRTYTKRLKNINTMATEGSINCSNHNTLEYNNNNNNNNNRKIVHQINAHITIPENKTENEH